MPPAEKQWYAKLQVIIPVIVALIGGLFLLIPVYFPRKEERENIQKPKEYELIFVDQKTMKPFQFDSPDEKVKVYCESPPLVLPITLGTTKFTSDKIIEGQPTILEFENFSKYSLVDRKQQLHEGTNDVIIELMPTGTIEGDKFSKKHDIKNAQSPKTSETVIYSRQISGLVQDGSNNAVSGAKIIYVDMTRPILTDSTGRFKIVIKTSETRIKLKAEKQGFKAWSDYVQVDKNNLIINLERDAN